MDPHRRRSSTQSFAAVPIVAAQDPNAVALRNELVEDARRTLTEKHGPKSRGESLSEAEINTTAMTLATQFVSRMWRAGWRLQR